MWTPNGREVWVAVRGEDYLQVLDGATYKPTRRIQVPNGPGMTIFSPDGKYAYVCSTFTPETVVIDTASYEVVKRIKQASTFCPNIAATPDGSQVWFTLKDSGKVQVFSAQPPFNSIAVLETGAITNHVNFALTPKGQFAYVTIGGLRQVKVFTTGPQPKLVATIDTGDNPHGLWPSGDGSRMYVGLQLSNAVAVIDTASNRVLSTVDVGAQAPMALISWFFDSGDLQHCSAVPAMVQLSKFAPPGALRMLLLLLAHYSQQQTTTNPPCDSYSFKTRRDMVSSLLREVQQQQQPKPTPDSCFSCKKMLP
ncbi:hypothetical protein OEZ86_005465 [Tetradesmus obliquus]|nr:hypothetical protein OEZ86_005465 [Tetradesmus obliquus]